jgi:hypothetical protein
MNLGLAMAFSFWEDAPWGCNPEVAVPYCGRSKGLGFGSVARGAFDLTPPRNPIARTPRSDISVTLTPYFCPSSFLASFARLDQAAEYRFAHARASGLSSTDLIERSECSTMLVRLRLAHNRTEVIRIQLGFALPAITAERTSTVYTIVHTCDRGGKNVRTSVNAIVSEEDGFVIRHLDANIWRQRIFG